MTKFRDYAQVSGPTLQIGYAAMPAGSTLLQARLTCETWFSSTNASGVIQNAPPNTIMGISLRAAGVAPELITDANSKDGTWYIAGYGVTTAVSDLLTDDTSTTPHTIFRERIHCATIQDDIPTFEAASMSFGISINWLGSGFYAANQSFLTYTFEAWYD